jgi:hypothetical protein
MSRKSFALISVRSRAPTVSICTSFVVPDVAFAVASVLVSAVFYVIFLVTANGFVMVDHLAVVAEFVLLTVGAKLPRPTFASKGLAGAVAGIVAGGSVGVGAIEILLVFFTLTTFKAMHVFGASGVIREPNAVVAVQTSMLFSPNKEFQWHVAS